MGFIGILIMPIILVITLKTIDSVSENLDKKIVFAASITSVFSLINSSYFTVLITHGLLVTIIILYIMNENNYNIHKVYHSNNEYI